MPGFEYLDKDEKKSISDIFANSQPVLMSVGFDQIRKRYLVREFEKKFSKTVNSKYAVSTSSGTAGLYVALKSLSIGPGDEVIMQSFTFIAVVEAIVSVGAKPIFVNVDQTLNIDLIELPKKINKKTKAIISAGMLGNPIDVIKLKKISKKFKIPVIDDSCETLGSKYKNNLYGNNFDITIWSFDQGKTITTGEGGMITLNNRKLYNYCRYYIDHGHENKHKVSRAVDKIKVVGFNFRMTELQAAVGLAQLKKINQIIKDQKKNYMMYLAIFQKLNIKIRPLPKGYEPNYDTIIVQLNSKYIATKFINYLKKNNIYTKIIPDALNWHYVKNWRHLKKNMPKLNDYLKTDKILSKCISLPIFGKQKIKILKKNCRIINDFNFS